MSEEAGTTDPQWTLVADVVFPVDGDDDTLPLYLGFGQAGVIDDDTAGPAGGQLARARARQERGRQERARPGGVGAAGVLGGAHLSDIVSRHSAHLPADSRVSFATYFNAFPASYWRRWTTVNEVRLGVTVEGAGSIVVYKSNVLGHSQR